MIQINGSIVLYNNKKEQLIKAINSFLNTSLHVKLYLVDNSSNNDFKELSEMDSRIEYIFNDANLGYGSAHNIAIQKSIDNGVAYHLVLNPDIYFKSGVLEELFAYMESNLSIGNLMPKVLYPNGEFQYLCKLLPTPFDWISRFLVNFINLKYLKKINDKFEMRFANFDYPIETPYLSGCFMFLRTSTLKNSGIFDENIFLHTEDTDLSRRIFEVAKNIYYPSVYIYHEHAKEAYKNKKIMYMQIKSMVYYFNKWGWFLDKRRREINSYAINQCQKIGEINN